MPFKAHGQRSPIRFLLAEQFELDQSGGRSVRLIRVIQSDATPWGPSRSASSRSTGPDRNRIEELIARTMAREEVNPKRSFSRNGTRRARLDITGSRMKR